MAKRFQRLSIALSALLILAGPTFAGPAEDLAVGYDAYSRGHFAKAAKWFRKAAQAGNVTAQDSLGVMHANGEGVQRDYVLAYMWFGIAMENVSSSDTLWRSRLVEFMAETAVHMTPTQIAEAEERARNWSRDNWNRD